jgi:recombinational DNA repair protein (RecF pathway)
MQGFIISLHKVKEEDLIVTIISQNSLDTLYRFYGARHGTINLGFKIDYETEGSAKSTIRRLKDVIHIGYSWINDYKRLQVWQDFVALFYKHLKETEEIGSFYFNLLEESSQEFSKQNPKRVAIESYVKLLKYEGRLHKENICFLCSQPIKDEVSLIRAFLPTHKRCSQKPSISKISLDELYKNNSTLFLNDNEVEILYNTLLEGF